MFQELVTDVPGTSSSVTIPKNISKPCILFPAEPYNKSSSCTSNSVWFSAAYLLFWILITLSGEKNAATFTKWPAWKIKQKQKGSEDCREQDGSGRQWLLIQCMLQVSKGSSRSLRLGLNWSVVQTAGTQWDHLLMLSSCWCLRQLFPLSLCPFQCDAQHERRQCSTVSFSCFSCWI